MRLVLALALLLFPLSALAQDAPALSDRMAPFARMVGDWHGAGWIMTPEGRRAEVRSDEAVTIRLSGNALLVEGRHFEQGQPGRPVHDAMAMIVWDARTNAYRMRSALANGMNGDFPIVPRGDDFVWSMDTPGGRIEYVITITGREWTERGTRTGPDGRQTTFFEMRLLRRQAG